MKQHCCLILLRRRDQPENAAIFGSAECSAELWQHSSRDLGKFA